MNSERIEELVADRPKRIKKLPELLINQIAAGEVVERPASIIKELLENALDANTTKIEISLKTGGMEEIKISDNGWGLSLEDIPLAFERHATSKIYSQEDLEGIHTFGFRGEALSAIASVSQVTITTRTLNEDFALEVTLSNGEFLHAPKKTNRNIGTSFTVRSLFDKVPARQKFLRTPATELSHCIRALKEIALGNPQCVFSLSHHDRTLVQYNQTTLLERFKEVIRPDWEPDYFFEKLEGMRYEMFLSPPSQLPVRGELFLFINQRCIRNRTLLLAVKQAYLETFGIGHEPSGSLYLTLRSDWVDPNVHPQKHEVRFLKQEALFQWILSSLRKKLAPLKLKCVETDTVTGTSFNLSLQPFSQLTGQFQFKTKLNEARLVFEDQTHILITEETKLRELAIYKLLSQNKITSKALASPLLFTLTEEQKLFFIQHKAELGALGFEMELFGELDIVLNATPPFLYEDSLLELVPNLLTGPWKLENTIQKLAEKSTLDSFHSSLSELNSNSQGTDGKPVFFKIVKDDLKRYFN